MLNAVSAADHAVVLIVYSTWGRRLVPIVVVAGRIAAVTVTIVIAIVIESVAVIIVAVLVDDGLIDVAVVVVAHIATPAATPIHSPGAEAPTPPPQAARH